MLVSEVRPWFHTESKPSKHYNQIFVTLAPPGWEKEKQAIKCYLIQPCLFPTTTLLIQTLSSFQYCPRSLSIFSLSGSYHPAGVCANLFGTAVHQSWVVMATRGQKFYAVISILQTISCVSPPSTTALLTQAGVEVSKWLCRHTLLSHLGSTND